MKNKVTLSVFLFLLFLYIGSAFLFFLLPKYIESNVFSRISQETGLKIKGSIRRIGLTGIDAGDLSIGNRDKTSVSVQSVQLDYSPSNLFKNHIDSITIGGLELNCEIVNGSFVIPGLDWKKFIEQTSNNTAPKKNAEGQKMPLSIGSFKILNATLVCRYNGQNYRLPFEFSAIAKEGKRDTLECILKLYPRGQVLIFLSKIHISVNKVFLSFHSRSFQLDRFGDITKLFPGLIISGSLDINGISEIQLNPFQISRLTASCIFNDTEVSYKKIILQSPQNTNSGNGSFRIDVEQGIVKYTAQLNDITAIGENIITSIPSISLTGNININSGPTRGELAYAVFELRASDTDVSSNLSTVKIPVFSLAGDARYNHDGSMQIVTVSKFENTDISHPEYNMDITGISGEIPFQWPSVEQEKKGRIFVDAIHWNTLNLGTVSGTIYQKELRIIIECIHDNIIIPGLTMALNGEFNFFSERGFASECNFKIPYVRLDEIDLGKFIPTLEGVTFSGELESKSDLFISAGDIRCSLNTAIRSSTLEFMEKGLTIEGINLTLFIPDLLKMRSVPNQFFYFKKASFGGLAVNYGKVEFQIESPQSILIESSGFNWCSGRIYTRAVRILSGAANYSIDLYCDRLNIAEILEQLSIAKAKGSGTVTGRIPVRFENGNLIFDDGFLFSEPGVGGVIHVAETGISIAGTPQNTSRHSQLEFAKEALKKFRYNWVKLLFITEREDLILKMSLDGEPAEPLPFSYNRKLGTFTRMRVGIVGKAYYSIRLDINFRLPLNKFLYYIRILRPILKW